MSIFSRRKRLLTRTPKAPKMSSRRQFHRALRRHPAWPAVMAEAAARARAQESLRRSAGVMEMETVPRRKWLRRVLNRNRTNVITTGQASRIGFRRKLRQKRAFVVALIAVGALVALLNGIGAALEEWRLRDITAQSPSARFGAATTFDGANSEMLIFGGFGGAPTVSAIPAIQATWGFNGYGQPVNAKWVNRNPIHQPSSRGYASMAYDEARRNVVLFGGAPYRSNAVSGETWTWDGQDWTLRQPPEPRPEARQNASMVYDAHRKVTVMFGGRGADGKALNDTWTWNGLAWKIMSSAGAPSPRHSAAMAYDVCRAEAVMFGGDRDFKDPRAGLILLEPADSVAGQTWTWNGAKWTQENFPLTSPSPPARIGASMTYAPHVGRVLLYGGLTTADNKHSPVAADQDFWMWDGIGWEKGLSELSNAFTPVLWIDGGPIGNGPVLPRAYASFVFNPTSLGGKATLFGGTPADASRSAAGKETETLAPQVALPDTWWLTVGASNTLLNPRRCDNPVPIPPDETFATGGQVDEPPKAEVRDGVQEVDQLPVLLGTDWPQANRVPKVGNTPNPNYVPPPDCPNYNLLASDPVGSTPGGFTHLATDPKRNRVYQFVVCDPERPAATSSRSPKLLIGAYDGTTLKLLGSALISVDATRRGRQTFTGDLLLHDAGRGQFIIASQGTENRELVVIRQDLIEKGVDPVVKKVILAGKAVKISFFDHPKTGRAKLLINRVTSLSQLDLEKSSLQTNSVDWNATPQGCENMGNDSITFNARPMRSGNRVYSFCSVAGQKNRWGAVRITITENADGSETAGTTTELFPGPYLQSTDITVSGWEDPKAERMLFLSQTVGGRTLYVFDGKASRYVGRAGLSTAPYNNSWFADFGFDQETGRLYVHMSDIQGWVFGEKYSEPGGLLLLDTRLTPIPQATNFTQFSYLPGSPIATLPPTQDLPRRVFMRGRGGPMNKYPDGQKFDLPNEMFYTVLADEVPVSEKPELAELDALTIPVAESPGKTEASFEAEGSAYGIRLRSVGGIWSALRPPTQMYEGADWGLPESVILGQKAAIPTCVFPDRELMAGWVPGARLSDLDAGARSSGLEVDTNSKTDLVGPFTRCNPPLGPSDLPPSGKPVYDVLWPLKDMALFQANTAVGPNLAWGRHFKETECVGDSSQANEAKLGDLTVNPTPLIPSGVTLPLGVTNTVTATVVPSGGKAPIGGVASSATCNQKGDPKDDWVAATSRGALGGSASSDAFSVGEGYSNVVVGRDPVKGVVVTATAVATGIKLPGITIGHVTTTAVAWSNGRPGTGRASFSRKICNVYPPPLPVNPQDSDERAPNTGCLNDKQQKKMVDDFNARMGINGKMILPIYDSELFTGSPGGYIAGVIKPVADEVEDQLFAKDYQREVAGLVIEFYKDTLAQGSARQVLQLAAVRAVTGFGVQCNSELVYSLTIKDCVAFAEDFFPDEVVEEEEFSSSDDETAFNSYEDDSGWTPIATGAPEELALGRRIGRFIENLPVLRRLPIRQMGEALLAGSVWLLLGLPLLLASRRFALNLARRS